MHFVVLNQLGFKLLHHLYLVLVEVLEAHMKRADRRLEVIERSHRLRVAACVEGRHRAHAWHAIALLLIVVLLSLLLVSLAMHLVLEFLVVVLHLVHLAHLAHLSHVVRLLLAAHLFLHLLELLKLLELLELDELLVLVRRHKWIWKLCLRVWRNPMLVVRWVHIGLLVRPLLVHVLVKLRRHAVLHVHVVARLL